MLPKIETAISYIGDYATRGVLITKLGSIEAAMAGQTGTIIKKIKIEKGDNADRVLSSLHFFHRKGI